MAEVRSSDGFMICHVYMVLASRAQVGEVTCCATSALAVDVSAPRVFGATEEFWCHALHPVFFGYYTTRIATKREKVLQSLEHPEQLGEDEEEGPPKVSESPSLASSQPPKKRKFERGGRFRRAPPPANDSRRRTGAPRRR